MNCPKCGADIENHVKFCNSCGFNLSPNSEKKTSSCSNCGTDYEGVFCPQCGKSKKNNVPKIFLIISIAAVCFFAFLFIIKVSLDACLGISSFLAMIAFIISTLIMKFRKAPIKFGIIGIFFCLFFTIIAANITNSNLPVEGVSSSLSKIQEVSSSSSSVIEDIPNDMLESDEGTLILPSSQPEEIFQPESSLADYSESIPDQSSNKNSLPETMGQKNALKAAKNYISIMPFSYSGIIRQLEFEKYSSEDAIYAADNCGADWNEQAAKSAKNYLSMMDFSRDGLIEQLEFEGFTNSQAVYGVESVGY